MPCKVSALRGRLKVPSRAVHRAARAVRGAIACDAAGPKAAKPVKAVSVDRMAEMARPFHGHARRIGKAGATAGAITWLSRPTRVVVPALDAASGPTRRSPSSRWPGTTTT
jgi:hypothetical protein